MLTKDQMDANGQYVPLFALRNHPELCKDGLVYLDLWPISPPLLGVFHPEMMAQFCQDPSMQKHPHLYAEFKPFTQNNDLVNQEGEAWKTWRSIFNPGFSAKNLLSLVPAIVEEVDIFRQWIGDVAASGQTVKLEDQAMKTTVDVIGRAVLGARLHTQTRPNPMFKALKAQVAWLVINNTPSSLASYYNPIRPLMMWNNNRIMGNYFAHYLKEGIKDFDRIEGPKTINSLAVKAYRKEVDTSSFSKGDAIDPKFLEIAIAQMKIFIFAGHDTTASTLCFAYYYLWRNQATLAAIRAEHDAVLGPDVRKGASVIAQTPTLLNQLPYTTAVLKETLRLCPPVGSIRKSPPGSFLVQPETGKRYPIEGWMLFSCSVAVHRVERFWPKPDEFIPERWLVRDESDPLHPVKNAWRPFELGPRNCIGQELALVEMRTILAMTVREFDIVPMYGANDKALFGEQAYQTLPHGEVTAHPKLGMPVSIRRRVPAA